MTLTQTRPPATGPQAVLVTGAAGGIGRAIVEALLARGRCVVAADLNIESMDYSDTSADNEQRCIGVDLDVTDADSRQRVVDACVAEFGRIDSVVNCAGLLRDARIEKLDPHVMAQLLDVNLVGPIDLIRRALPELRKRGGSVVNIASRAWLGTFGSTAYSASKGGLVAASRSLALELGPDGITVNCIAPGFIETAMTAQLPDEIRSRTVSAIPVGRPGRPEDVATLVDHLVSDGSYITGQVLLVCGGRSIGMPIAVK